MTAISQYQCYSKFEALQNEEHALKLRDTIYDFHEEVKEAFKIPSYVIDIVVFPDFTCHVVELNPFGKSMSSGSALYHWSKDEDLLYGKLDLPKPPIRILKQLIDTTGDSTDKRC